MARVLPDAPTEIIGSMAPASLEKLEGMFHNSSREGNYKLKRGGALQSLIKVAIQADTGWNPSSRVRAASLSKGTILDGGGGGHH